MTLAEKGQIKDTQEILKKNIKQYTIRYGKRKAKERKQKIEIIKETLEILQQNNENQKKIEELENSLEEEMKNNYNGARIRARLPIIANEKPSKHFLHIENNIQKIEIYKK